MAARRTSSASVSRQARAAAGAADTRSRVRDLTVRALRARDLDRAEIARVVHDVLDGAAAAVGGAIPADRSSVLRQVFDGMHDAFNAAAEAGARAARSAGRRGRAIREHAVPAAKRVRAANDEFLGAVSAFARKTSSEIGEELDALVKRTRRAGGAVAASAGAAARAIDGRLLELTGEAARAGLSVARRAAGQVAMAASGLLEGLGEVAMPPAPRAASRRRQAARPAGAGQRGRGGKARSSGAKRRGRGRGGA
jgi:hypothetical protein